MNKPSYYNAVSAIVGNDKLCGGYSNGPLDQIVFVEGFTDLPTEAEIQAKLTELQAEYEANQYQRDRASQYPSIQDQLDMQYWDAVNGTNKWQEAVAKVKTDNPKPE